MNPPMTDCHAHHPIPPGTEGILSLLSPDPPENGSFSLGVHPLHAQGTDIPDAFAACFRSPRCVAVGECGLDRRASQDLSGQETLFRAHAAAAEELRKPLIVHSVRTRAELLRLRKELDPSVPWILHGCRGNESRIRELADAGFVLSFGEGLLRDAGILEPFFHTLPADRMLIETDESPVRLETLYAQAASFLRLSREEFTERIHRNYRRIFFHD